MYQTKAHIDPFLFLVATMWVFACSLFVLNAVGFVPYYVSGEAPTTSDTAQHTYLTNNDVESRVSTTPDPLTTPINSTLPSAITVAPEVPFLPEKIVIPGLNKELTVVNPTSDDVETLDAELLRAVVRYPQSGLLNADGNIFIFGHSSHLRTVHNPLFKAFNGIETLAPGSLIQLIGGGRVFVYRVIAQQTVSADTALVDFVVAPGKRLLTLSTCDSFGAKTDRFVTTAEFSVSYAQ